MPHPPAPKLPARSVTKSARLPDAPPAQTDSAALPLLLSTERCLEVRLCYHDYLRRFQLPYALTVHESEHCLRIKKNHPGVCHGFCGADGEVDRLIRQHPDGWAHRCPFGVRKIAVAVTYEGGLAGVLFAELPPQVDASAGAPCAALTRTRKAQSGRAPLPHALYQSGGDLQPEQATDDCRRLLCAVGLQLGAFIRGDAKNPADGRRGVILHYIEDTISGPAELAGLGKALNLSASRAGHLVRELFRRSFRELALEARANRAALLLAATELPLSEIALRLGFTDQSHLTRTFRQHFSQTPATYRRSYREHY